MHHLRLITLMRRLRSSFIALLCSAQLVSAEEKAAFASYIELPWSYVIGGHAEGRWHSSEAAGRRLTAPLTKYRLFTLAGEVAAASAAPAVPGPAYCADVWLQKLTTGIDAEARRIGIGVQAGWEPMPRKCRKVDLTQEVYVEAMKAVLTSRGVERAEVKLTQLLRVDLDGDGADEVLTAATHYLSSGLPSTPRAGDYSVVTLRSLSGGKVQTQLVNGEVYAKADLNAAPNTYEIAGLLDLDGDGTLEVLIRSSYYEGSGMTVWQLQKGVLVQVLSIGCGG